MARVPTALVVSDFPIIGVSATKAFAGQYNVQVQSWSLFVEQDQWQAETAIVDVTALDTETALALIVRSLPDARLVVCSLHWNEVHLYRYRNEIVRKEGNLPSLFAVAA